MSKKKQNFNTSSLKRYLGGWVCYSMLIFITVSLMILLYFMMKGKNLVFIVLYVDELIITRNYEDHIK
jgi:hypothetical protein